MSQLDLKIGPKIKSFRRQMGLQANKLAEQLGISASYLNLIESGKRKIDGDLLLKVCEELKIELSDLTKKSDLNLVNDISELLDDQLFEDLDIVGPEVKDLVNTNPKIARALIKLGDQFKEKDHEMINKVESLSGKIIDKDNLKSRIKNSTETLLIHGDSDQVVPSTHLLEAKDFLIRNNINVKTLLIKNCDHHIPIEASSTALNYILKRI